MDAFLTKVAKKRPTSRADNAASDTSSAPQGETERLNTIADAMVVTADSTPAVDMVVEAVVEATTCSGLETAETNYSVMLLYSKDRTYRGTRRYS